MAKTVRVEFDVDGKLKTYRFDLDSGDDASDFVLAASGYSGVGAYAASLNDAQLDDEIERMVRYLYPIPWDRFSRIRAIRLMAEKERRLNVIGETWAPVVRFSYAAA